MAVEVPIEVTAKAFDYVGAVSLQLMLAPQADLTPGEFVRAGGDVHLYLNHLEQAREQLTREPGPLPTMNLNADVKDLFAFCHEDFTLEGYEAVPSIRAPIAV